MPSGTLLRSKSESNMNRSFTLRRRRSQPRLPMIVEPDAQEASEKVERSKTFVERSLSKRILRRIHSRSHSHGDSAKSSELTASDSQMRRAPSRRDKIVHVIANPDSLFVKDGSRPPESRFNPDPQSTILRTFFSPNIDFAPSVPLVYTSSQRIPSRPMASRHADPEAPIFDASLLPARVLDDLPVGYGMRPLTRPDYTRGFLEVLRVTGKVGYVSQKRWEERCDYLQRRGEEGEEYVLVVVDNDKDRVIGTGRWVGEKGFMNNLATVGRIEDIAVARDQKGKKMGLRILEALVEISSAAGCHKTVVNCSEANEGFHGQCGFVKEGSMMILQHGTASARKAEALTQTS